MGGGPRGINADLPIRVQNEGDVPHLSITRPLLKLYAQFLEALACLFNIVDGDRDMSESLSWFRVTVCVSFEIGVGLGAVVMCELEDTCAIDAIRVKID